MVPDKWAGWGTALASFMFLWAMGRQFIPRELQSELTTLTDKVVSYIDPYDHITISEYDGEFMGRSNLYITAEAYLSNCCIPHAHRLKVEQTGKETGLLPVTIDKDEDVDDDFDGVRIWWLSYMHESFGSNLPGMCPRCPCQERRYYRLSFQKSHRELVISSYLPHVLEKGKAITVQNRQRRLFTNNRDSRSDPIREGTWSHVPFEHPSTFNTLAMEDTKKKEIIDDLIAFQEGRDYYARIGKAWKRGYLIHGPPGTGKSSLIAAMANFLEYDVYDLQLTAVKSNTGLRRLFTKTTGKSIIVIEDVDRSLKLTSKRNEENKNKKRNGDNESEEDESMVTLSGLLNFIDGLWSACGRERIIVFTTNHVERLDPALIRRGRMDMRIEMSYCGFEAFKVLAKNYLNITTHPLFDEIKELLEEVHITPADVAENLMYKSTQMDVDACLLNLIKAINKEKEKDSKVRNGGKDNNQGQQWTWLV